MRLWSQLVNSEVFAAGWQLNYLIAWVLEGHLFIWEYNQSIIAFSLSWTAIVWRQVAHMRQPDVLLQVSVSLQMKVVAQRQLHDHPLGQLLGCCNYLQSVNRCEKFNATGFS